MPRPHLRRAAPLIEAYCWERDVGDTRVVLLASCAMSSSVRSRSS
ncbi:MAG TPA: hypothetical protein VNQ52_05250 [Microbacteriaceae bacterium]|nr:hypothetical protein [Microbacteriaceae bacterium]